MVVEGAFWTTIYHRCSALCLQLRLSSRFYAYCNTQPSHTSWLRCCRPGGGYVPASSYPRILGPALALTSTLALLFNRPPASATPSLINASLTFTYGPALRMLFDTSHFARMSDHVPNPLASMDHNLLVCYHPLHTDQLLPLAFPRGGWMLVHSGV